MMTTDGIKMISTNFNNYWTDILLNWNILNIVNNDTAEGTTNNQYGKRRV